MHQPSVAIDVVGSIWIYVPNTILNEEPREGYSWVESGNPSGPRYASQEALIEGRGSVDFYTFSSSSKEPI